MQIMGYAIFESLVSLSAELPLREQVIFDFYRYLSNDREKDDPVSGALFECGKRTGARHTDTSSVDLYLLFDVFLR
jgi:hypothetical protein